MGRQFPQSCLRITVLCFGWQKAKVLAFFVAKGVLFQVNFLLKRHCKARFLSQYFAENEIVFNFARY